MAAFVPHWSNKYFHVMASIGIVSNSPYIMTASQIASVRVFKTALPTLSVRDRAIIVLNHHRF
jgi:ABC-type transport system involved in cytochrome bd biosynthesis fused ATPase/permease subunit